MEQRIALTLNDGQPFSGRLQAAENFVPGSSTLEIIDGGGPLLRSAGRRRPRRPGPGLPPHPGTVRGMGLHAIPLPVMRGKIFGP
jgi:hypothetical protein